MRLKKICVFCASSELCHVDYFKEAEKFGKILAENDIELVYGGGGTGLMGAIANSVLKHKGIVTGVIPKFMMEREWGHKGVTELIETETMSQRKDLMLELSDAVVSLPGGCGTLEEILEAILLKQVGKYLNPIILLNTRGFYDYFENLMNNCVEEKFMDGNHGRVWHSVNKSEEILEAIKNSPEWSEELGKLALLK